MRVNRRQFAEIVGVSQRTVGKWIDAGMPAHRPGQNGKAIVIETASAIEWLCERGRGQPDHSIPDVVTARQFATLVGCTPASVTKWVAEGMPTQGHAPRGYPLQIWVPAAIRWLCERARHLSGRGRPPAALSGDGCRGRG